MKPQTIKLVNNYYEKLKAEFEPKPPVMTRNELTTLVREIITEECAKLRNELHSAPPAPEFLSVKEAAAFLNLAVTTLYEKTSLKLIPFHKRDKKLYFKKEELKNWLLEKKSEAIIFHLPIPKRKRKAA
jgi:excisionase family DNA binding protein